jgi:hypothetical protein
MFYGVRAPLLASKKPMGNTKQMSFFTNTSVLGVFIKIN